MNVYIILFIAILLYVLVSRSNFNRDIKMNVYSNEKEPQSCNYSQEDRIYPSGNIPGSYLGLSPSEDKMLLERYVLFQQN